MGYKWKKKNRIDYLYFGLKKILQCSYKIYIGINKSKKVYIFFFKSKFRGLNLIIGLVNFFIKYRNKM